MYKLYGLHQDTYVIRKFRLYIFFSIYLSSFNHAFNMKY